MSEPEELDFDDWPAPAGEADEDAPVVIYYDDVHMDRNADREPTDEEYEAVLRLLRA